MYDMKAFKRLISKRGYQDALVAFSNMTEKEKSTLIADFNLGNRLIDKETLLECLLSE